MTYKYLYLRQLVAFLLVISGFAGGAFASESLLGGVWQHHAAISNKSVKIVDTPQTTYFLAYSTYADAKYRPHPAYAQLFMRRKAPGARIVAASSEYEMTWSNVSCIEYNAAKGYLFVLYDNGEIELLYDDGRLNRIHGYAELTVPYDMTLNSVALYPQDNKIYIATAFGFAAIDDEHLTMERVNIMGRDIEDIVRVGDDLILLSDNKLYRTSATMPGSKPGDAEVMSISGTEGDTWLSGGSPTAAKRLYALGDNSFLLLNETTATVPEVVMITSVDNAWQGAVVSNEALSVNAIPLREKYEGVISPCAGGVMIDGATHVIRLELPKGVVGDPTSYIADNKQTLDKITDMGATGSWDFKTFWKFGSFEDYSAVSLAGDEISADMQNLRVQGPREGFCASFLEHPDYGMLAMTGGISFMYTNNGGLLTAQLSGYKSGEWRSFNPQLNDAEFVAGLTAANQKNWTNTWRHQYPGIFPDGMAIDPENPAHVYVGSTFGGLMRYDLANPGDRLLRLATNSSHALNSVPGYIKLCDRQASYQNHCRWVTPGFDSDNTLWAVNYDLANESAGNAMRLLCWPSADRAASANAHFNSKEYVAPTLFTVPGIKASNYNKLLPLKHESNKNRLLYTSGSWGDALYVIDHKGTPKDNTDDDVIAIPEFRNQDGSVINTYRIYSIYEDPSTGEIWLCGEFGTFYFTLDEVIEGGAVHTLHASKGGGVEQTLDNEVVTCVLRDNQRRMWVGTQGGGVICYNSSLDEQLGEWNADESGLIDNTVLGIGWDNATESLFVGTPSGICRYLVPGGKEDAEISGGGIKVTPSVITPGYHGWVTVGGLKRNVRYEAVMADGSRLSLGESNADGVLQFHAPEHLANVATGQIGIAPEGGDVVGKVKVIF